MNKVLTIKEYIAQGFTEEEAPIKRKTDIMFNNWDCLTDTEKEHYAAMCKWLGL